MVSRTGFEHRMTATRRQHSAHPLRCRVTPPQTCSDDQFVQASVAGLAVATAAPPRSCDTGERRHREVGVLARRGRSRGHAGVVGERHGERVTRLAGGRDGDRGREGVSAPARGAGVVPDDVARGRRATQLCARQATCREPGREHRAGRQVHARDGDGNGFGFEIVSTTSPLPPGYSKLPAAGVATAATVRLDTVRRLGLTLEPPAIPTVQFVAA